MPMFRRKPAELEAFKLNQYNIAQLERWCGGSIKGTSLPAHQQVIDIQTNSGEQRADMGDWIIKGPTGEFYPCKPDIFDALYENV